MNTARQLRERLTLAARIVRPTAVVQLADDRLDLFAKLEFLNGVGSIKDRPAFWILKGAVERGEVGPNTTIIESSSGNFACALATFARMLELNFVPVIDPSISPQYEALLRAQCAQVVKVEEVDDTGGFFKTRLQRVRTLLDDIPDSYWPNQYANPDAMDAHYQLTAAEIIDAAPRLDYVFLAVGSAGTIAGVSRRLKEHDANVRIIAVDADGSVIFGNPPKRRHIAGLGSSIRPPLVQHALIDDVLLIDEPGAIVACHQLLADHGLFIGGSTGSTYCAIQRFFNTHRLRTRPRVLFLCCDRGTAYLHNVFDRRWAAWRQTTAEAIAPVH